MASGITLEDGVAKYTISIRAGARIVQLARELFGDRVGEEGDWGKPTLIHNLTYDEVCFAIEYFDAVGANVHIESKV